MFAGGHRKKYDSKKWLEFATYNINHLNKGIGRGEGHLRENKGFLGQVSGPLREQMREMIVL